MAFRSGASTTRTTGSPDTLYVPPDRAGEWAEPEPEKRDWKKIVLVAGLATLSWVATYVGMLELIQSNMGSLPLLHKVIVGFSVAMLMTMIVWLLDQLFSPIDWFTKFAYIGGYVFLTIISVGFGFGFYWKVLESRSEAARSATSAVGQVQASLHGASTRMEQLQATLTQLSTISSQKAELERTKGTSCPNSSPGDGPRRKMRDADAARFSFSSDFVKGRVGSVKSDMAALDAELAKIVADDPSIVDPKTGTRNAFMRQLGRRLDMTVTGFNAFRTDPQLRQIRTDLADRAERTTFPDGRGGTISCPDAQLQTALRGVVRAIDQLPTLEKPQIAAVEGSEATIEAFRRLTATFYGLLSLELPPSADELREMQQRAVQSIDDPEKLRALNQESAGLSKRDYIPLGTAIFVDLCLLLVSIGRPMNRFVATRQRMIEAERGPVFPILSRFNEIHNHEEIRRTFDVFREVIFESGGTYYVAVPLNAPRNHPDREQLRRDAQTLANLCYALEGQGILTRPWKMAPTLVARRKLRRQGSKFIECYRTQRVAPIPGAFKAIRSLFVSDHGDDEQPAFRIYAFKNGAWPEMILGAVMGAAGRVEAERRRHTQYEAAAQWTQTAAPTAAASTTATNEHGMELPGFDEPSEHEDESLQEMARALDGTESERKPDDESRRYRLSARFDEVRPTGKPRFSQRFGSYAGLAEAEFATYRDLNDLSDDSEADEDEDEDVAVPANSNTSPVAAPESEPVDIVVPFPATRATPPSRAPQASAEPLSEAAPVPPETAPAEPMIGVELRRETATFSVPVSQASLPDALAKLTGTAFADDTLKQDAQPQMELTLAPPDSQTTSTQADHATETTHKSDEPIQLADLSEEHLEAPIEEGGEFHPPLILRRMVE